MAKDAMKVPVAFEKKRRLSIPFRLPFRLIKLRPGKQPGDGPRCRCLGKGIRSSVLCGFHGNSTACLCRLPQAGKMYRKENYGEKERSRKTLRILKVFGKTSAGCIAVAFMTQGPGLSNLYTGSTYQRFRHSSAPSDQIPFWRNRHLGQAGRSW